MDLPSLITALSDPQAYPHPVARLHVVQTHASCVFLTGEYVYKIKKPVNFGFLDYSTLERRRRCCEQELALNRRLCPEVYLDLVPAVRQAGRLRVAVPGTPVEWAVRMRQLPEADMLPARLAAGTVTAAHLEGIAAVLAAFHARAAAGPAVAAFGAPEAVARNVEENFAQTEHRVGDSLPAEHLAVIREYSRRFLAEHRELFHLRMREGRIRDGHGDLRAQNLCLHPGLQPGIQVLDCIEFNDRFRYGDVAADLAYLAMDLDLAGRADLRQVLVDRYVQLSADPQLRQLLPFYGCYRAYVRGKIALLTGEEAEIPAAERRSHQELAAAAFDLSRSYAERRERPALLITVGYSGSGKSALARELARRLPAVHLASDAVRKELAGVAPSASLSEAQYAAEKRGSIYAELRRRALPHLLRGEHVLLDATFLAPAERENAAALAAEGQAELWVVECRCPDAVIRRRLLHRAAAPDSSDAGLAVYEAQRRDFPDAPGSDSGDAAPGRIVARTDQPAPLAARSVLRKFWKRWSDGVME